MKGRRLRHDGVGVLLLAFCGAGAPLAAVQWAEGTTTSVDRCRDAWTGPEEATQLNSRCKAACVAALVDAWRQTEQACATIRRYDRLHETTDNVRARPVCQEVR